MTARAISQPISRMMRKPTSRGRNATSSSSPRCRESPISTAPMNSIETPSLRGELDVVERARPVGRGFPSAEASPNRAPIRRSDEDQPRADRCNPQATSAVRRGREPGSALLHGAGARGRRARPAHHARRAERVRAARRPPPAGRRPGRRADRRLRRRRGRQSGRVPARLPPARPLPRRRPVPRRGSCGSRTTRRSTISSRRRPEPVDPDDARLLRAERRRARRPSGSSCASGSSASSASCTGSRTSTARCWCCGTPRA